MTTTSTVWDGTIDGGDLGTAPSATTDPNYVSSKTFESVSLSVEFTGGTSPTLDVVVWYWNPVTASSHLTGDTFTLDPATENLKVLDPNGHDLGFTATINGSPTTTTLHVGRRL